MENILEQYKLLLKTERDSKSRLSILFSIIDFCLTEYSFSDECYLYAKEIIQLEFDTFQERKYGYDQIKIDKYLCLFKRFPSPEKISILEFFKRMLVVNQYTNSIYRINDTIEKEKYRMFFYQRRKFWWLKVIYKYPSLSLTNLLITFGVLFVVYCIVLLPAPFKPLQLIEVEQYNYSSISSHVFTVLGLVFGLYENISIVPLNNFGVILLIAFKCFFSLYIIGYLLNEFKKRINIE